ncbi:hypothetical protein EK904_011769, partial [Melospiza melodia maxima]
SPSANSQKDELRIKGPLNDHIKTEATRKGNFNEVHKDHLKIGASLAGVEQMQIDGSAQFHGVGGLSDHISALKEMVILPLLYPDVFEILKFKPPRVWHASGFDQFRLTCAPGVKICQVWTKQSPPCCSQCWNLALSWVPSGLQPYLGRGRRACSNAPNKQKLCRNTFDFSRTSAVTKISMKGCLFYGPPGTGKTLVARALANECSRGDRKVTFFMRSAADCMSKWVGESERQLRLVFEQAYQMRPSIIFFDEIDALAPVRSSKQDQVHRPQPVYLDVTPSFYLKTTGLCALRRRYPQIHESDKRLKIDARSIKVTAKDFATAMQKIVPASQRAGASPGRALPSISKPLLENTLERILQALQRPFPHAKLALKTQGSYGIDSDDDDSPSVSEKKPESKKAEFRTLSRNPSYQPTSFRPRFLLVEEPGCGQAFDLAPAILHALEKFPAYTLDLPTLFVSTTSQEETCSQLIREAQRTAPSIIYIPQISLWWEAVGPTLKAGFTGLLNNIPYFAPVLLLATSDVPHEDLPEEIKTLFNTNREEVFNIPRPTCAERRGFYENLIMKQAAEPPASRNNADSQVHPSARCSQVDGQPQVLDKKAIKILKRGVFVDYSELRKLLDAVVTATENVSISSMAKLYSVLSMCIYQQRENPDKTKLV